MSPPLFSLRDRCWLLWQSLLETCHAFTRWVSALDAACFSDLFSAPLSGAAESPALSSTPVAVFFSFSGRFGSIFYSPLPPSQFPPPAFESSSAPSRIIGGCCELSIPVADHYRGRYCQMHRSPILLTCMSRRPFGMTACFFLCSVDQLPGACFRTWLMTSCTPRGLLLLPPRYLPPSSWCCKFARSSPLFF